MPLKDISNTPPRSRQGPPGKSKQVAWSVPRPQLTTPAAEMMRRLPEPISAVGSRPKPPPPLSDGSSSLGDLDLSPDVGDDVSSNHRTSKSLSFEGAEEAPDSMPSAGLQSGGVQSRRLERVDRPSVAMVPKPTPGGIDAGAQVLVLEARLKDAEKQLRAETSAASAGPRIRARHLARRTVRLLLTRSGAVISRQGALRGPPPPERQPAAAEC